MLIKKASLCSGVFVGYVTFLHKTINSKTAPDNVKAAASKLKQQTQQMVWKSGSETQNRVNHSIDYVKSLRLDKTSAMQRFYHRVAGFLETFSLSCGVKKLLGSKASENKAGFWDNRTLNAKYASEDHFTANAQDQIQQFKAK